MAIGRAQLVAGVVGLVFLFPAKTNAQDPSLDADFGMMTGGENLDGLELSAAASEMRRLSGKQLFHHEWQAIAGEAGDAKQPHVKRFGARRIRGRGQAGPVKLADLPSNAVFGDGLGPLYNATSCSTCHLAGGGSGVQQNVTMITVDPRSDAIKDNQEGARNFRRIFPGLIGPDGLLFFETVIHDRSTRPGYDVIRNGLSQHVPGGLRGQWFDPAQRTIAAIAEQPVIAGRYGDVDFYLSQRNAPPLFGVAEIESINPERLKRIAQQQAIRTDGKVTGRVAGKFGWRGQVSSLVAFVRSACAGELGLNQTVAGQAPDPADATYVNVAADISAHDVSKLVEYVGTIPRPVERAEANVSMSQLLKGEHLFTSIGCSTCHLADLPPVTGMFSDLLLHDMGPKLQAPSPAPIGLQQGIELISPVRFPVTATVPGATNFGFYGSSSNDFPVPQGFPVAEAYPRPPEPRFPRGDFTDRSSSIAPYPGTWEAMQLEWRTAPLWGIADTAPYLHDGRAATLDEAILWHGGEAQSSRDAYMALQASERSLVTDFLSSLHAPNVAP